MENREKLIEQTTIEEITKKVTEQLLNKFSKALMQILYTVAALIIFFPILRIIYALFVWIIVDLFSY